VTLISQLSDVLYILSFRWKSWRCWGDRVTNIIWSPKWD